jgi:WD repeat-containing protein 48
VPALALDTSTRLADRPTPEGILYSGGRDGLVISWDLRIAMQKRKHTPHREEGSKRAKRVGTWEAMTGWADDSIEEEGEEAEEKTFGDGDILGDVGKRLKTRRSNVGEIPYEHQWEMDMEAYNSGKVSFFCAGFPSRLPLTCFLVASFPSIPTIHSSPQ